jgi:hypothetical protein
MLVKSHNLLENQRVTKETEKHALRGVGIYYRNDETKWCHAIQTSGTPFIITNNKQTTNQPTTAHTHN